MRVGLDMQSNVLILTYWSFDDSLIQTYTLPYLRIIRNALAPGSRIVLLTLEKEVRAESVDARRIRDTLAAEKIEWLQNRYHRFGIRAAWMWIGLLFRLTLFVFRNKVSRLHCWGTPVGSMGLILSWLTGRELIVDSYEPHAEAMVENGTWKRSGLAFQILFLLEKWQTRRATCLIAANAGMKDYAREKLGVLVKHMFVRPACVDLSLFSENKIKSPARLQELGLTDKIVCVYAGKLGGIYLDKEVFDFLAVSHTYWGEKFKALLLTNHAPEEIKAYCQTSGLDPDVVVARFVPHRDVPEFMGLGDFALTPVKPVPTKRYCTPIKDGEYWALGLPVVIPAGISEDADIIRANRIGAVMDQLNHHAYRVAIEEIDRLLQMPRKDLTQKIRRLAIQYRSFDIAEKVYREIYGR